MTAFSRYAIRRKLRHSPNGNEDADTVIGWLALLILGWLWVPAMVEWMIG